MKLTIQEIEHISRSVASEYADNVSITSVTGDGEAEHAEVLVTVTSLGEPRLVMLNVSRVGREDVERQLRDRLRAAAAAHGALLTP